MNRMQSFLLAAVALLVGVVAAASFNIFRLREQSTVTFRPGIMSTEANLLADCNPFPFTATHHPTEMIQIELPGTFDPKNLRPVMTQMSIINAPPWTNPDLGSAQPYSGPPTNWTPKTKLDMNLDLGPQGGPKRTMVLIKVIVRDPAVTFRTDGFAITTGDVNGRKMFCKFDGGYQQKEATFVAFYYKATPNKPTMGSYGLGLVFQDIDPGYILPIFVDPEVQNNGID